MATYHDRQDFSRPLHVDCSVEYELPNAARPPVGARTEPLLMIHPCYYRRAESQRRSPFINNLPASRSRVQYPKRDPMLCGTSSGDSGVSGLGPWDTASPLAPDCRLNNGPDSGILEDKSGLTSVTGSCWEASTESASARLISKYSQGSARSHTNTESNRELRDTTNQVARLSWAVSSADLLNVNCAEVNNNSQHTQVVQPAVGVAAVAACKVCQPQQAVATGGSSRHRIRAVEPGPEHSASSLHRRPPPAAWPAWSVGPAKRCRLLPPPPVDCCKVCTHWNYPKCRGDSMLRLYQV